MKRNVVCTIAEGVERENTDNNGYRTIEDCYG